MNDQFSQATAFASKLHAGQPCEVEAKDCPNTQPGLNYNCDANGFCTCCYINQLSFTGDDLVPAIPNVSSGWECQQKCQETHNCNFFTWNAEEPTWCHLKSSITGNQTSANSTSGPSWCVEDPLQRQALLFLYRTLDGPNWHDESTAIDWEGLSAKCFCTWGYTVQCTTPTPFTREDLLVHPNGFFGSVTLLQLDNKGLRGRLDPLAFVSFKDIFMIYLDRNPFLIGELPQKLSPKVTIFGASNCGFTGRLPGTWNQQAFLHSIYVSSNQLEGALPAEWSNLTGGGEPILLELYNNSLSGTLPAQWGSMINLEGLWVQENDIHGSIPESWCNLANLTWLDLGFNKLDGSIPQNFERLSKLTKVALNDNSFYGSVPSIASMPLTGLLLQNNALEGQLPTLPSSLVSNGGTRFDPTILLAYHNFLSCSLPNPHASAAENATKPRVDILAGNAFMLPVPNWLEHPPTNLFVDSSLLWTDWLVPVVVGSIIFFLFAVSKGFGTSALRFCRQMLKDRLIWWTSLITCVLALLYFAGAQRYECMVLAYQFTAAYLYDSPHIEWSSAVCLSLATALVSNRLLSASATTVEPSPSASAIVLSPITSHSFDFAGDSVRSNENVVGKTWLRRALSYIGLLLLSLFLTFLVLIPGLYSLTFSLPEQNAFHMRLPVVLVIRKVAPMLIGLVSSTAVPYVCRLISARIGMQEANLLVFCSMFTVWLSPLIAVIIFHDSCFRGWLFLWQKCQRDSSGAFVDRTFDIIFKRTRVLSNAKVCAVGYDYSGRCPRAVIEVMGPLLMGHVLGSKLVLPGMLIWLWAWTQNNSCGQQMARSSSWRIASTKYLVGKLSGIAANSMDTECIRVLWTVWCQTLLIFGPLIPPLVPFVFYCFATSSILLETRGQLLPRNLSIGCISCGLVLGWGMQAWLFLECGLHGGVVLTVTPIAVIICRAALNRFRL